MKKTNIIKYIMLAISCVMVCFALGGQSAEAASTKSTYKVNNGSSELGSNLKIKGTQKKKIYINVKSKGTLKVMLDGEETLNKNENVKIALVNPKGKTVSSSTATMKKHGYIRYDVKPGTYKLVVTTKNIKKSKTRAMKFSYTMNKDVVLKADGKTISDITNKYGNMDFKFVNDKDQVVLVTDILYGHRVVSYNIYDSKGKWLCSSKSDYDVASDVHYLKKGTYRVKATTQAYAHVKIGAYVKKELTNNMTLNATSRNKAVVYNGKAVNFVHYGKQSYKYTQWLKVDTSKGDVKLYMTCPDNDEDRYRTDYTANISDVNGKITQYYKFSRSEITVAVPGGASRVVDSRCISLKKGTGVHYIAVTTYGTDVATLAPVK